MNPLRPAAVNEAQWPTAHRLTPEKDVGRHAEVVEDVQLLMDEGNALARGVGDGVRRRRAPSMTTSRGRPTRSRI